MLRKFPMSIIHSSSGHSLELSRLLSIEHVIKSFLRVDSHKQLIIFRFVTVDIYTINNLSYVMRGRRGKKKRTTYLRLLVHRSIYQQEEDIDEGFVCVFFSVRRLLVLRGHSVISSLPQRPMISDFEGFSISDVIHYIYFPILILEKEPRDLPHSKPALCHYCCDLC